jgi:hypothetical protein
MFRIFSFSNKIFISLLAILVFGLSSCRTTPPNYDDYYRELNYYNGYSMGLDISLLRCDFSSFVNINQDLKSKLDRVNTETTISPNSNLDGLYFVGDRTFSLIGRAGSSSFTAGTA